MSRSHVLIYIAAAAAILCGDCCPASVPALVSYQGKLADASGASVPDGPYDMVFSLYDQETEGDQLWSEPQTVQVTGGLFIVLLGSVNPLPDSAFEGSTWLEVWVNRGLLSPRVRIVSAGYAMRSRVAETVPDDSVTSAKLASDEASLVKVSGGVMTSSVGKIGVGTNIPQQSLSVAGGLNIDQDGLNDGNYSNALTFGYWSGEGIGSKRTDGGNQYGLDFYTAFANRVTITNSGDVGIGTTTPAAKLDVNGMIRTSQLGTTDAAALELKANNIRALRIEPMSDAPNIIGGAAANFAASGVSGAFVGGGGSGWLVNRVMDDFGMVGGGVYNQAGDGVGTTSDASWAAVAGGYQNTASGQLSSVGGGLMNVASAHASTVGGGEQNSATNYFATVPGGALNLAAGQYSFAAGQRAKANHAGGFVWADSASADFASTASNQFLVRAGGGVGIGTNSPGAALSVVKDTSGLNNVAVEGKVTGYIGEFPVGVRGIIDNPSDLYGRGVEAINKGNGYGLYAKSETGNALYAASGGSWYAATIWSDNGRGLYIRVPDGNVGLVVSGGSKNAVVTTSSGARLLHSEESTEVWFTDYGFGRLKNGRATVAIDPIFAETVSLDQPYHVFVQLNDSRCEGVAVENKTATRFEVVELQNGRSDAEFSYRVVAKRRSFEKSRLDRAEWADDDPNLNPEKKRTRLDVADRRGAIVSGDCP